MAKKDMEEITRFIMTNSQLKDASGKIDPSHLKDLKAQVNAMVRALESATGSIVRAVTKIDTYGNAITSLDVKKSMAGVAEPVFDRVLGNIETRYGYQAGSLSIDPYASIQKTTDYRELVFHKDFHGAVAKRSAKEAMERAGGFYQPDPSKAHQDRAKLSFNVSETDWQDELAKTGGDIAKAKSNLARRFSNTYLKDAMRYSRDVADNQKEKDDERERRREEKEEKSSKRKAFHTLALIVGALTAIADVTRRILTATLTRASEVKRESVEAKSLGISYGSMREYKAQEKAMGLKEGAFASAISALQAGTGDISNLDTNMIKELAKVMQGSVNEAIQNGLGRSNPEKLMGMILDEYYRRGQLGINSLGQQVGRYNAERELSTALEKAGLADVADILRNMFYTNDTGIYKGRIGTEHAFADYMSLATAYTNGLTPTDYKRTSEIGAVVDNLKKTFKDLEDNLKTGLLLSLEGIINKINNMNIGKSAEQKAKDIEKNKKLNRQQIAYMQELQSQTSPQIQQDFEDAGIDFKAFGIEGVSTAEEYAEWRSSWKSFGWSPKTDRAKFMAKRLEHYLQTAKGQETLRNIAFAVVAKELENQARKDIDAFPKTGNIEYKATDYTPSGVEGRTAEKMEWLTGHLVSDDAGSITRRVLMNLTNSFFGEKGFTYEDAVASGTHGELTRALVERAKGNPHKVDVNWKKFPKMNNVDFVRRALKEGLLTEEDVRELASLAYGNGEELIGGYGINQGIFSLARQTYKEQGKAKSQNTASSQMIINEAKKMADAQKLFSQATADSSVEAKVIGYDAKTGTATVLFTLDIESDGKVDKSITVPIHTDTNPDVRFSGTYDMTKQAVTTTATTGK